MLKVEITNCPPLIWMSNAFKQMVIRSDDGDDKDVDEEGGDDDDVAAHSTLPCPRLTIDR